MLTFIQKYYRLIITIILIWFLTVSFLNAWNDSATFDEVAHIPASYSYLTQQDMRLNPEHPPLIKDLAGFPLLFLNLNFDTTHSSWTTDNVADNQWNAGRKFLYHSGNNADLILFWSRVPIILLSLLLGLFIFKWVKELAGVIAGLIAFIFYSFDPNILGHNHYVTTDIGVTAFIVFSFYYFLKFIKKPTWKNTFVGGIFLGLLHIAKFSSVLLLPIFVLILFIYPLAKKQVSAKDSIQNKISNLKKYIGRGIIAFLTSIMIIWLAYIPNTFNMPKEKIAEGINYYFLETDSNPKTIYTRKILLAMNEYKLSRPLAEYSFGLSRVFQRVAGGNRTYFMGQISSDGSPLYFPTVFILKETIPHLIFYLLAIGYLIIFSKKYFAVNKLTKYSLIAFIIFYSYLSITGNLNIGLRHLFPIFPFIYILTAIAISKIFILHKSKLRVQKYIFSIIISAIFLWLIAEPIIHYPNYLSYFNQFAGGPKNGYRYVADSNADWGQDLKRLNIFLNQHPEIRKIRVDYFGGGSPEYYLGEKFIGWWASRRPIEPGWYAISTNTLQDSIYDSKKTDNENYRWLLTRQPVYQIGTSIFIYYIN